MEPLEKIKELYNLLLDIDNLAYVIDEIPSVKTQWKYILEYTNFTNILREHQVLEGIEKYDALVHSHILDKLDTALKEKQSRAEALKAELKELL